MMKTKTYRKVIIGIIAFALVACIMILIVCNHIIVNNAEGKAFSNINSVRYNRVGLLFCLSDNFVK